LVGGERRVVGVDGIEGEIGSGRHIDDFGSCGSQLAAECVMLGLGGGEVGGVVEA
jgi:hypothetical protein